MHGLVFASRREILNSGTWTVFCKRSNATPAVWLYVGEYENTLAGTMKAEEFSQQTLLVSPFAKCALAFDIYSSLRDTVSRFNVNGQRSSWTASCTTVMYQCVRGLL